MSGHLASLGRLVWNLDVRFAYAGRRAGMDHLTYLRSSSSVVPTTLLLSLLLSGHRSLSPLFNCRPVSSINNVGRMERRFEGPRNNCAIAKRLCSHMSSSLPYTHQRRFDVTFLAIESRSMPPDLLDEMGKTDHPLSLLLSALPFHLIWVVIAGFPHRQWWRCIVLLA